MKLIVFILVVGFAVYVNSHCEKLFYSGVKREDQEVIVNYHNELRTRIARGEVEGQPKASNMKALTWDDKIAKEAQDIANTCIFEHVKVHDSRFSVGQNLYMSYNPSGTNNSQEWKAGIDAWFNEHKEYKFGKITLTTYNHYTQVVWANTYTVGCGFSFSPAQRKEFLQKGYLQKLYVCNYGPSGNYLGQEPYEIGEGCEDLC